MEIRKVIKKRRLRRGEREQYRKEYQEVKFEKVRRRISRRKLRRRDRDFIWIGIEKRILGSTSKGGDQDWENGKTI